MEDDEITKPGIPVEMARRVGTRKRSPSQDQLMCENLAIDGISAVFRNSIDPAERSNAIRQWIGAACDVARRELGDDLARQREASAILQREVNRLREMLKLKDPRRER